MALLRKFFYRKQPDGLLEISERVYVFDCCFTTDILEDDEYKVYIGGIVSQLREYSSDASFMVFNFREGDNQSQMTSILSDYDMTVMDYPRHYEGCPLLTVEMIHHFLKSSESWLSLGQQNVLLMHCEQGGWPVLAFMLATLLIYRKQFTGEQRTLEMIYKQAPRELLQLMSPLNPLPSQLRYLQYVSRRNVGSRWPPVDRALTLDCIILRVIPNMDGEGGCCPIFRIYGPDPLMASNRAPKVLFSASKRGKHVRHYKQADSDLIKLDIHCHVQGDVVMECISLDGDQEREQMMFRVMFNTAFIRSNILMLNRDEIDTLWNAKDHFPKDFRAEVLFSEMDSTGSLASINLPTLEEKDGLPVEAFAKVQEIFSNMDWLETKPDVAANVLQHIVAIQEKLDPGSPQGLNIDPVLLGLTLEKVQGKLQLKEEENQSQSLRTDTIQKKSVTSPRPSSGVSSTSLKVETQQSEFAVQTMFSTTPSSNISIVQKKLEPHELQIALQRSAQSKFISQRVPQTSLSSPASCSSSQGSPVHTSRYQAPSAIGITALLHDDSPSNDDEVVRPVTVSLPSSAISSPITKLPKFAQLRTVSSPRTPPPPPPPPPPTLTPLSRSELNRTDSLVNKICEVSSSGTNSPPALPSLPVSSSPASTIKSSFSAPLPAPPPLPSFSGGSQLSAIDKLPSPPSISEPSPSPILNSSSLTAPSLPPPPSFPGASPSSFSMALPPTPPPPPPSLTRASSSTFSMAPPPPPPPAPPPPSFPRASPSSSSMAPPPPPTPLVTSSVSCSVSSSSQPVKNLAIPETPPLLVPLQSGSAMGLGSAVPVPPSPPPSKSVPKDSLSIKSAQPPPVPPPAAPFSKGLSKASSASPPAHSGVSNGNVPSVPGPPPCAPFNMKGWSLSHTSLRNQAQPRKANLKPYHWLKLTRAMQGSIWAEAQKSDEASKAPEFDMSELESLFSAASPSSGPVSTGRQSNRRSSGAKSEKVQLIELRRAYNCEIMLSKVKVPLGDLTSSVLALDESALDVDQVDNLIKFCPTKEEMDLLKGYNGDKGNLGRCEEFFLELMKVPRVESKLRVFSFKLQFHHQVSDLRSNLNTINSASEEIRSSVKLKRIMQTILSLGNALNQGTARGSAVGFRLDSLLKLIDTRARNNKMTLMHYLCKVLAEKLPELLDFPKDLGSLEAATKIQLKYLAEEMQAINKGLEKVVQELTASENDGHVSENFCQTLKGFLSCAESEVRSLASLYSNVGRNADALALYFGEDPARCPFEQVVSTLLNFVRMFTRAHEENCKQLEIEERKAEKDAENEKLKMGMAKKESENLIRTPIRSGNV